MLAVGVILLAQAVWPDPDILLENRYRKTGLYYLVNLMLTIFFLWVLEMHWSDRIDFRSPDDWLLFVFAVTAAYRSVRAVRFLMFGAYEFCFHVTF